MEPNYYSIIPATVRYDENLTANAKLLYGEITALANQMGYCWASNRYFANLYRVSNESISRYIRQLKESGYITVEVIRKESKEVEERRIYINDVPSHQDCQYPSTQNCPDPSPQKCQTPPGKNDKENTTSVNTTRSNNNAGKQEIVSKVISYLNAKTAQNYRMSSKANQRFIIARINEGYSLEDFYAVIDDRNAAWGNDPERRIYLRPETLFKASKFENYLNHAKSSAPKKIALDDEGWL